ncbi:MAG: hypothetical protein JW955_15955 [Sedimentisphaerales bacterium]|nr:hypothetical protein [Sedimentisphaerales bacterium]
MKAMDRIGLVLLGVVGVALMGGCAGVRGTTTARETDEQLYSQFQEPGAAYRGKPFWAWNGELKKDELIRQIHVMKEMGFGGFFMHSRTGLATEYLGDEWFSLVNACADEAQKLGMEAWLYDEDRWPSGTAGGLVTKEPKYRLKFMKLQAVPAGQFSWKDGIFAAFACDLDGINFSNCVRIKSETPAAQYAGKTVLVFTVEEMAPSSFYNGYTYADTMNREATDYFLKLTHEQYKTYCGDRLGRSIRGIFTDEPHRGAVMCGFGISNKDGTWMTPWTDKLPAEFEDRIGYDIVDWLPELFLRPDGRPVNETKYYYMELCQQLFLDNWAQPIHDWCQRNHMRLTGHVLHEDTLTAQATMQGSLMRFYECMHNPGVDVLTEGNRSYWIVKQLSSAARQLGQRWLLSELYGVTGWQLDFEGHKAIGDWQALFGINVRCPHLAWYTMEGEAKRDYPASIFYQSGWWRDYAPVETYFARLGLLLQQGKPYCDLLVINPVESAWCQVHVDWTANIATPKDPAVQEIERAYADLFHWLAGAQIDFDYGDEDMMSRLCKIDKDRDGTPVLWVGKAPYRVVLVGKMTTIRVDTLMTLFQFHKAGGKVIFAGDPPAYVDAKEVALASAVADRTSRCKFDRAGVVEAVSKHIRPPVRIVDAKSGQSLTDIFCQMRTDGGRQIVVAMDVNRDKGYRNAVIRVPAKGYVTEWDCRTAERHTIDAQNRDGTLEFTADFPPCGEHAYVITDEPPSGIPPKPQYTQKQTQICYGPFEYTLNEDNVCVLDRAKYRIGEGDWQEAKEVLKIDQAVRDRFGLAHRGGEMVQLWFSRKCSPRPAVKGQVTMAFAFRVEAVPAGPVTLCIEHPEHFAIQLNGHDIASEPNGWWIDPAISKVPLPRDALVEGDNTLELQVAFSEDKNIEAVYLVGRFGVRIDGASSTLIDLPEKLTVGDVTTQGLPFYSGAIRYRVPLPVRPAAAEHAFLELPRFEAACAKVSSEGHPPRMIAWQSYETEITADARDGDTVLVDVVLTRRNTFGPLHLVPKRSDAYGPGHWTTAGRQWSDNYQFWESGLLAAPQLHVRNGGY